MRHYSALSCDAARQHLADAVAAVDRLVLYGGVPVRLHQDHSGGYLHRRATP